MEPPKAKRTITSRVQVLVDKLIFIPLESSLPCMRCVLLCTLGCLVFWRFSCSRTDSEKTKSAPWSFIVAVKGCFQLMATKFQCELDLLLKEKLWKNQQLCVHFEVLMEESSMGNAKQSLWGCRSSSWIENGRWGSSLCSASAAGTPVDHTMKVWSSSVRKKTLRLVFQLKKFCIQVAQQGTGGLSMAGNIIRTGIVLLKISLHHKPRPPAQNVFKP